MQSIKFFFSRDIQSKKKNNNSRNDKKNFEEIQGKYEIMIYKYTWEL